MSSARISRKRHGRADATPARVAPTGFEAKWFIPVLFVAMTTFFYAAPLFHSAASIQWDAVDVHYSSQKYFSDNLLAGKLPYWTPYVYSGMPFLADPQTGAWYPLNWPFFLAGITPRAIEWELALHALLGCFGMFLLARDILDHRTAAILAAIVYAFSGFFAGHSSHVGMFQAAALFPWLLWTTRRAVAGEWRLYGAGSALVGACIVLAGHFQTALYCYWGLALFVASMMLLREPGWRLRGPALLAATVIGAALLAAIQILPGLELTAQSIRASADFGKQTNAALSPGALLTLFSPDHYGAVSGTYHGPGDITQFYFYQGLLAPLLAIVGLVRSKARWIALALLAPALWYATGPSGGFYLLVAKLPAFRSIRAPVHIWFVAALAIALLAAGGSLWLSSRLQRGWLVTVLAVLAFADLWYWNMDRSALAYRHASFDESYGRMAEFFSRAVASVRQNPLHRIWFEYDSNAFGPMNSALNTRTQATYGYNPLELQRYADYCAAAAVNPKLIDGLAVTHRIDRGSGAIVPNASALPRVSVPRNVIRVATPAEAQRALARLAPADQAILESSAAAPAQDPNAKAEIIAYDTDEYRIRYTAAAPTLLRVAIPWFPGWRAAIGDHPLNTAPVDLALTGVLVPAGTHDLDLSYRSSWFGTGIAVSMMTLAAVLALGIWGWRRTGRGSRAPVLSQSR
jgi:hypothetical protein